MFGQFLKNFFPSRFPQEASATGKLTRIVELNELLSRFGGCSFNDGLYRLHRLDDIPEWNSIVGYAFPEFANRITCFGYDWLGRHFAIDAGRREGSGPAVIMLEPGTGEALEVPRSFIDFHNLELIDEQDRALASSFFAEWLAAGNPSLTRDQCAGYKRPLFLGGRDTLDNLEISNLEVYWVLMGQLIRQTKGLPEGTPVRVS
jgi:hypothetical protein